MIFSLKEINTFYVKSYNHPTIMKFEFNDPIFLPHLSSQLSFDLYPGEVMVISGENGIGKTTFLKKVFSHYLNGRVAYCPQKNLDAFYDRTLVSLKEIFCSLRLSEFDQEQFNRLWLKFGLTEKENQLLSQLSGGESQALKFCLTMSKQSELYLLDEPTQYLDEKNKKVVKDFIEDLTRNGKMVMVVDHQGDWPSPEWIKMRFKLLNGVLMGEKS